jgi:plasmid stabilization system protein ParE
VRVEILPRAETDIIRQFRYYLVHEDAPAVAVRFREAVIDSVEQLKSYPYMGTVFHGSIPGLRTWPVRGFEAFRIYYMEGAGSLRVVRILHGKRDVRRILKQEKLP